MNAVWLRNRRFASAGTRSIRGKFINDFYARAYALGDGPFEKCRDPRPKRYCYLCVRAKTQPSQEFPRRRQNSDQRFADIRRVGAQAVYVVEDPFFFSARVQLLKLTSEARLGTIHELRRWPEEGALMSYSPVLDDLFRRAGIYVVRILKGANTADLPVEQPTKFEFVINLKAAKALGLTIPSAVFTIADDLIQWALMSANGP
jgi:hypothetical protein